MRMIEYIISGAQGRGAMGLPRGEKGLLAASHGRAVSSVGRASRLHREGRRFEPVTAHHVSACLSEIQHEPHAEPDAERNHDPERQEIIKQRGRAIVMRYDSARAGAVAKGAFQGCVSFR